MLRIVGPIPAPAGQPRLACRLRGHRRAYPRSRGATVELRAPVTWSVGLSPLPRGNRRWPAAGHPRHGPIPAPAGQPRQVSLQCRPGRAYPRSRGATLPCRPLNTEDAGLSPLPRGNPRGPHGVHGILRPIPAPAGQPPTGSPLGIARWAYPRSRGATSFVLPVISHAPGLSPLPRGNPRKAPSRCGFCGPIPAPAGQPARVRGDAAARRAYPRSRGATRRSVFARPVSWGLSPLPRGNRCLRRFHPVDKGPIPAPAGQPQSQP